MPENTPFAAIVSRPKRPLITLYCQNVQPNVVQFGYMFHHGWNSNPSKVLGPLTLGTSLATADFGARRVFYQAEDLSIRDVYVGVDDEWHKGEFVVGGHTGY
jgi:hypothetical protein